MSAVSNRLNGHRQKKKDTKREGNRCSGAPTFNKVLIHHKIDGVILLVFGIMIHPNGLAHVRSRGPPRRLRHDFPAGGKTHARRLGEDDDCVVWPCLLLLVLVVVVVESKGVAAVLTGWRPQHVVEIV